MDDWRWKHSFLWMGFNNYSPRQTLIALSFFIILITILICYYIFVMDEIILKGFVPLVVHEILLIICWIYVYTIRIKRKARKIYIPRPAGINA